MTSEEYRKAIRQTAPKPSLEDRMEWLEADASAQRTAILRLERQVNYIHIRGVIQAAVVGWLLWMSLT